MKKNTFPFIQYVLLTTTILLLAIINFIKIGRRDP